MITIRERYHNDPKFHNLVDILAHQIFTCEFSPSEVREAAMLASIIYEEQNIRKMRFIETDIEYHLRAIRKRLDKEDNGRGI